MSQPVAIFLAEYIGLAAAPWRDRGVECWLVDPKHPEGVTRRDGMVLIGAKIVEATNLIGGLIRTRRVVFVAGFPPCDDIASCGAKHWAGKFDNDRYFQARAAIVLEQCRMVGALAGCPWMFENPNGAASSIMGPPTFRFDPCDYGGYLPPDDLHPFWPEILPPRDAYKKRTGIWSGGGFVVPEPQPVPSLNHYPGWKLLGGKSERTKEIRAAGPRGFLKAVAAANIQMSDSEIEVKP